MFVINNYSRYNSLIILHSVCLIILSEKFCSFVMVHIFLVCGVPFSFGQTHLHVFFNEASFQLIYLFACLLFLLHVPTVHIFACYSLRYLFFLCLPLQAISTSLIYT